MSKLYENAVCLAPMVRAGTLPLRLLSLRYGADLVYTEEIIDKKIIATERIENRILNTVDFVSVKDRDSVVFRTSKEEKDRVVFQIGTSDPILALKAAQKVAKDVAAIDINMGCPKHFSIQGGMGAALLKTPQLAFDIIKNLKHNLQIPVSCKIRVLENTNATIDFVRRMEQAGADAIGVHGRETHQRPEDAASWDSIKPIVSAVSVPILANGDLFTQIDITKCREQTGVNSFLIARGALSNPSIFRKEGMLSQSEVVKEYLKVAADTDNVFQNTKYTAARMLPTKCNEKWSNTPPQKEVCNVTIPMLGATKNNEQLFALWDLQKYYQQRQIEFQNKAETCASHTVVSQSCGVKMDQPQYNDSFIYRQDLYCHTCGIQLLSEIDVALHVKGKKHKRKERAISAATKSAKYLQLIDSHHPEKRRKQNEESA